MNKPLVQEANRIRNDHGADAAAVVAAGGYSRNAPDGTVVGFSENLVQGRNARMRDKLGVLEAGLQAHDSRHALEADLHGEASDISDNYFDGDATIAVVVCGPDQTPGRTAAAISEDKDHNRHALGILQAAIQIRAFVHLHVGG